MALSEFVTAVYKHAVKNYNVSGWDFLVKCWSDSDIANAIGAAETPEEAIRNAARAVGIPEGARAEPRAGMR